VVDIVNQVLGEGEVSIRARDAAADDGEWHIQETAFAGYWRCCRLDADGHIASDALVAAAIPPSVFEAARAGTATALAAIELPEGAMNAPALLIEIGAALPGAAAGGSRQVNLSLLPLAPADRTLLGQALPAGGVSIISRGFGNCRIQSTAVRDVWRVQYFNSMNTLILDTIEVTAVPEVALASDDDLADSCTRLAELVQWMGEA
jgi:hydrogenase-1 operon protein HyaF